MEPEEKYINQEEAEAFGRSVIDVHILKKHVPLVWSLAALSLLALLVSMFFVNYGRSLVQPTLLTDRLDNSVIMAYGSWPALEQPQFFQDVKNRFIREKKDFIDVNLSEKVLRYYDSGKLVREFTILSIGREGSWWETPAGLYQILGKEENHFSSFGRVFMPWSLPFQGNFFIHGWPYYTNGQPVPPGYSGGCIRLSTEEAKILYGLVKQGTPLLIFENDFESDGFSYGPRDPKIAASYYLAADLKSNFVLAEKNRNEVVPIASLTKLMTALVATEYFNVERKIAIRINQSISTSIPRLKSGQKYTVLDLLHLLLQESSNEAAVVLAESYSGGSQSFIRLMNEKAKSIGMKDTFFVDAAGSNKGNVSSAEDLFILAKYLYNNRKFVLSISKGQHDNLAYADPVFSDINNLNIFAKEQNFVGGKAGLTTLAEGTALAIFEVQVRGAKRPIVLIILGSDRYQEEMINFYSWLNSNY